MRDITFRGKRLDGQGWAVGNPVEWLDLEKQVSIACHPFGCCIDSDGNLVLLEEPYVCKVDPETIGQFTGLEDVDGQAIYEGDIVECSDSYGNEPHVAEVKYRTDMDYPAFDLVPYPDVESNAISYYLADGKIEVIGNIYDNPELLK